jgi:hypothetical protein
MRCHLTNPMFEMTEGSYRPELHDILADNEHTVALMHATACRAGRTLDQDYAFVCHIRNGQIAELWEAWTEGPAWNEFWSWHPRPLRPRGHLVPDGDMADGREFDAEAFGVPGAGVDSGQLAVRSHDEQPPAIG